MSKTQNIGVPVLLGVCTTILLTCTKVPTFSKISVFWDTPDIATIPPHPPHVFSRSLSTNHQLAKTVQLSSTVNKTAVTDKLVIRIFCDKQLSVIMTDLIPRYTFSSINCNSLNMSSSKKSIHKLKLYSIARLKTDIIFLSDTRISNKNKVSDIKNIRNTFHVNPYGQYNIEYNSTSNKRGTAILIKRSLNLSEINRQSDPSENFLLLLLSNPAGTCFILGSIYGPNNYDPQFFNRLAGALRQLGNYPVILGGDWNCTVSIDPIQNNIDCHQMTNVPNARHSNKLRELMNEFNLVDPYRALWPNRRDYTFIPKGTVREYKSRLDFLLFHVAWYLQL